MAGANVGRPSRTLPKTDQRQPSDAVLGRQHVADAVRTMSQDCSANSTRASVRSRKPSMPFPRRTDPGLQSATMNDIASWLRAQIPPSTDPDRLERLAREAERQAALRSGIATIVKKRTPSKPPPGDFPPNMEGRRCPDEAQHQLLSIHPATSM
jgi:hypothetical protein